ncbi:galactosylceramide sulfotransferase-like [Platysternon megacephalum]|uniref:Galactosylceramide sulfotransferase-like n=1 Tax=Platysternon megacephalum TaxID=55544 RepID=A0A4D9DXT6_9SAUR|nr:galactosylceramide sulfotransferase-like [Platysternon megacephalum]
MGWDGRLKFRDPKGSSKESVDTSGSCSRPSAARWSRSLWGVIAAKSPVTPQFGGDVTLSCLFPSQPGMDLQRLTVTWQKEQVRAEALVVHSHRYGKDQLAGQDEVYSNRTRLDPEGLARGNVPDAEGRPHAGRGRLSLPCSF